LDFSIIIAHRGSALGLWATVHSCEIDLSDPRCKYSYNYRIVTNGEKKLDPDSQNIINQLQKANKLGYVHHSEEPLAPPTARQMATEGADGKFLFFFDNHCMVTRDYFRRAIFDFEKYGMDMLHSTTRYFTGEPENFHYTLTLDKNFWTGQCATFPDHPYKPYPVAMGGHGGFAVKRDAWEEVGGYWTGFEGYGGEESYFDLKMAMLDKTNYLDPYLSHWHYAGTRPYRRHFTDDYYCNMMMCANIIGGQQWMYRVYENFAKSTKFPGKSIFALLEDAQLKSAEHAAWFAAKRKRTLEEQLVWFRDNNISH